MGHVRQDAAPQDHRVVDTSRPCDDAESGAVERDGLLVLVELVVVARDDPIEAVGVGGQMNEPVRGGDTHQLWAPVGEVFVADVVVESVDVDDRLWKVSVEEQPERVAQELTPP